MTTTTTLSIVNSDKTHEYMHAEAKRTPHKHENIIKLIKNTKKNKIPLHIVVPCPSSVACRLLLLQTFIRHAYIQNINIVHYVHAFDTMFVALAHASMPAAAHSTVEMRSPSTVRVYGAVCALVVACCYYRLLFVCFFLSLFFSPIHI